MAICKVAATEEERRGHFAVRQAVFVEEQGLFVGSDVDEHDEDAIHIVAVDRKSGEVVGAVRCYEEETGIWFGGRLAVLEPHRHSLRAVGPRLVRFAEQTVARRNPRHFLAYIQLQNVRFFERLGWQKIGEPAFHVGVPHQVMESGITADTAAQPSMPEGAVAHA